MARIISGLFSGPGERDRPTDQIKAWDRSNARLFSQAADVFGETPKTATGTVALPGTGWILFFG